MLNNILILIKRLLKAKKGIAILFFCITFVTSNYVSNI